MSLLRSLGSALAVTFRRKRFEDAASEELQFHLDLYADDLVKTGMSRDDARRQARLELGGAEALKEGLRAARGQRLFDEVRQDARYALRRLRRSRALAVVAVLALGIGVNVAVFSVIHASLLRPLPHPHADRLVHISSRNVELGRDHLVAPLDFFDFERRAYSFARVAAYYPPGFTLTDGAQAERVSGARASSGIFDVFGVQPALGRGFLAEEDRAGTPAVAVISHELWMRRYKGDPAAVGQAILLSGRPYTLVGVLPEGFHSPAMWPRTPDVWVPLGLDPNVGRRDARMLRVIGRLREGVTVEQARVELDVLAAALGTEYPETNRGTGATVSGLLERLTRDARPSLYALMAAVLALLLVACGNAAGLLVGESLERRHEFATRLALGASRGRIVRQIVAENLILGILAAGAGFGVAVWVSDSLVAAASASGIPRAADIRVDATSFIAGAMLSLACTSLCALFAAYDTTRARDLEIVRNGRGSTPRRTRVRAGLIALEAALSLALLAARPRFYAATVASFAVIAVLLAGFGIFGAVTSAVADRRRELGVRLALGASPGQVLARAAGYGARPTLLGLVAGMPLSLAAGQVLRQQLYGVGPADFLTLLMVVGVMTVETIAAALLPALNAMHIDPAVVLKHEAN